MLCVSAQAPLMRLHCGGCYELLSGMIRGCWHSTSTNWAHIASTDNPADSISRGQSPLEFLNNSLWLNGPTWLADIPARWPVKPLPYIVIPEQRPSINLLASREELDLQRFSSFKTLQRVIAYCIRFHRNTTNKVKITGQITTAELLKAHQVIIKYLQKRSFAKELETLRKFKTVKKDSAIFSLSPFIDSEGILRVGGRLQYSDLEYSQKHPILLPRSEHLTQLIIREQHVEAKHAGILGTLNAVRNKYWPIDGKNTTRHIVRQCIQCFKAKPGSMPEYPMGNLPKDRVTAIRPFQ
ncbi:PREDICTED: uncharacterized protein LOC108578238, partial [Habropoda laboriosa]|uniref:uncharacterized protein LOC108578238 n=1 Tax=Habropoda laboriosa TaxID=597456 RepID=UPI00083E50EE